MHQMGWDSIRGSRIGVCSMQMIKWNGGMVERGKRKRDIGQRSNTILMITLSPPNTTINSKMRTKKPHSKSPHLAPNPNKQAMSKCHFILTTWILFNWINPIEGSIWGTTLLSVSNPWCRLKIRLFKEGDTSCWQIREKGRGKRRDRSQNNVRKITMTNHSSCPLGWAIYAAQTTPKMIPKQPLHQKPQTVAAVSPCQSWHVSHHHHQATAPRTQNSENHPPSNSTNMSVNSKCLVTR